MSESTRPAGAAPAQPEADVMRRELLIRTAHKWAAEEGA